MKKSYSFFHKNITTKLFIVNGLVCIALGLVVIVVLFSFQNVKEILSTVFARQAEQAIENAQIGRGLSRILSDTNLLVTTFYGKDEFLKSEGESLISEITALTAKSTDAEIKASLENFTQKIREVLEKCGKVNHSRGEIRAINQQMNTNLQGLEEALAERILNLATEGEDISAMEQLNAMIPGHYESLLRISLRLAEEGLEHFKLPLEDYEHPILSMLEELSLRFQTLAGTYPEISRYGTLLTDNIRKYSDTMLRFYQVAEKLHTRLNGMNGKKEELLAMMEETDARIADTTETAARDLTAKIFRSAMGSLVIFFVTLPVVIFAFLLSRSVRKSLNHVIHGLLNTFDQMAGASVQVLSASQNMSERSSEQAASLEEMSVSLEEMTAMTRQNADDASHAFGIMKGSVRDIKDAGAAMTRMTQFIEEISDASEEIRKIIKAIDKIAFRTNLLALNAAIEAARAGEAGAGFAVVSDEVRNLAMQSADAAKDTAAIIKATVRKMQDGSELIATANEAFDRVKTVGQKVGKLLSNISAASDDQAQGIGHISEAAAEMDTRVQQNAAYAQELAVTSENMNIQAGQMNRFVQKLATLTARCGEKEAIMEDKD